MHDIISIEFVFENCERFSIDAKYFASFYLGDIRGEFRRITHNAIVNMEIANVFYAGIFSEGNGDYDSCGKTPRQKFDRLLAYNDITDIILRYDDGTRRQFFTLYNGDEVNAYQTVKRSALGNLYIVIQDEKTVDDIYPDDEINDEESISFTKEMILE